MEEKGRRQDLCPPFIITHPISLISILYLHFSLLDILYYTHKKCGEDYPCSFGANPSNKSSSKAHNPLTRQYERRSSPHSHLYSPEPHPKITSTTHGKSSIFMVGGGDDTGLSPGSRYKTTIVPPCMANCSNLGEFKSSHV